MYKVDRVLSVMMGTVTMLVGFFLSLPIVMEQVTSDGRPLVWWLVASPVLWMLVVWFVVRPAATVVHEAGHAWACLVLGVKISAIYLGNDVPNRPRFTVGKITITLTRRFGGRVEYDGTQSAARNAFITAAGPLANLVVAGTLAVALAAAHSTNGYVMGLACIMAGVGVGNLLPYRARTGLPTDGARLLAVLAGGQFAEAVRSRDPNSWLSPLSPSRSRPPSPRRARPPQ